MSSSNGFSGVLPVVQTPFHEDDSVDFDGLAAEITWMHGHDVDGTVVGMVSEVLRLSTAERRSLAKVTCETGLAFGPVVVSVGAESTKVARDLAVHAEAVGATAVMAIPPVSLAPLDDALASYYEALLGAVTVPVVVQDASGYVGRPMPIALLARLQEAFGERVLFKPEAVPIGPRLSALRDATEGEARIFEGSGGIALVDSHRRGVTGTMPAADVCWAIVALWRALEEGDEQRVDAIDGPLSSLISLQTSLDAFVSVEKHLLHRQGVLPNPRMRGPVSYLLDAETRAEVDRLFERLRAAVGEATSTHQRGRCN